MPRPLLRRRCQQCRARKVKCDGAQPVCVRCQTASRECTWLDAPKTPSPAPVSTPPAAPAAPAAPASRPSRAIALSLGRVIATPASRPEPEVVFVTVHPPREALKHPQVAERLRHYIFFLADWYDLHDAQRYFRTTVPSLAQTNPLLLSATLAFSAASQYCADSSTPGEQKAHHRELAEAYHAESIEMLITATEDPDNFHNGQTLAAICLLRSYELIMSRDVRCQNHLHGLYSLITSERTEPQSRLFDAGFWNYLRQDITVALICKRGLLMDLKEGCVPQLGREDSDFANKVTCQLAKVINRCLRHDAPAMEREEWEELSKETETYVGGFLSEPINSAGLNSESYFPAFWMPCDWDTSSWQYWHTAMIILCLAEPRPSEGSALKQIQRTQSFQNTLDYHATYICALAINSSSTPVWINSFGPISFCARWLRERKKALELIDAVRDWGDRTGWPVGEVLDCIQAPWDQKPEIQGQKD